MTAGVEYGARIVSAAAPVYMKDFRRAVVDAWVAEYGAVTPVQLVARVWNGDAHSGWELVA